MYFANVYLSSCFYTNVRVWPSVILRRTGGTTYRDDDNDNYITYNDNE